MKLCCQGCGADLQVTEDVRFVTCNYCQSKLEIVRDSSVTHTRVLEKLERTTERIAGNLKVIELQNDLERLDREWEALRESMMSRGKNGELYEPSTAGSVIGGVAMAFIGVVMGVSVFDSTPPLGVLIGLGSLAAAFVLGSKGAAKAEEFQRLKERYHAARRRMHAAIEQERRR